MAARDEPSLPKGLKRLSLVPGSVSSSRTSSSPPTPASAEAQILTYTIAPLPASSRAIGSKRTSSISYYTPESPSSPSLSRGSAALASLRDERPHHGLSSTTPSSPNGLQRSASYPRRQSSKLSPEDERRVPPPLTLVEKHADLLTFIAQKESKCLELREQLAQQEAELVLLKRKWERIVSRSTASSSDPILSLASSHFASPALYQSHEGVGEMVGAIRDGVIDGVQELGRIFVSGSLGKGTSNEQSIPASPTLSLATRALSRHPSRSSSMSSIAAQSPATSTTNRTSLSSVTSVASSSDTEDSCITRGYEEQDGGHTPTLPHTNVQPVSLSHILSTPVLNPSRPSLDSTFSSDSGSSLTRRRSARRTVLHEPDSGSSGRPSLDTPDSEDDKRKRKSSPRESRNLAARLSEHRVPAKLTSTPNGSNGSSISNILTSPLGSPSSWVSLPMGINEKLKDMQKNQTFTKSSKRASLLLSDMMGSLSSALSPSSPSFNAPSSPLAQSSPRRAPIPSHHTPSTAFYPPINLDDSSLPFGLGLTSSTQPQPSPTHSHAPSLLDEELEGAWGKDANVLVPTSSVRSDPASNKTSPDIKGFEDEDWNW